MTQVKVTYHREQDSWWAESDDVAGFSALGATFEETRALALDAIRAELGDPAARVIESLEDGAIINPPSNWFRDARDALQPYVSRGSGFTFGGAQPRFGMSVATPVPAAL